LNFKARVLKKWIGQAIDDLQTNMSKTRAPNEILEDIQERCAKNAGQNPISGGKNRTVAVGIDDVEDRLQNHRKIISKIHDVIRHDVDMAMVQLDLVTYVPFTNQNEGDEDEDFFVEEIPQADIIRHK
jgi:hypothetical protein